MPSRPWGSSTSGPVSFYMPDQRALNGIDPEGLDIDRDWEVFGTGVYVWVLQTFLRLRAAGAPVLLARGAPASGLVVTHADYVERLLAEAPSAADLTVVATRADRPQQVYADIEVVQNASSVADFQIFIPSWPQPGLIPRVAARGTRIDNVGYFGARKQLHDELASESWTETLCQRGLQWDPRMISFAGNDQLYSQHGWNDYSRIDVVVALRPTGMWDDPSKPAAKLTNAWAAGVPAILSPELAYRELRRSNLDYLEARNAREALAAVEKLRADPALYTAVVANGLERAREFEPRRIAEYWAEALWRTVPLRTGTAVYRLGTRVRGYRGTARRSWSRFRRSVHAWIPDRTADRTSWQNPLRRSVKA